MLLHSLTLGNPALSECLFTLQHWNTNWQLELPFRSGIAADFLNSTAIRSPHYGCLSLSRYYHLVSRPCPSTNSSWKLIAILVERQGIYTSISTLKADCCYFLLHFFAGYIASPSLLLVPPSAQAEHTVLLGNFHQLNHIWPQCFFPADPGVCNA